jgi:hypothetical protein
MLHRYLNGTFIHGSASVGFGGGHYGDEAGRDPNGGSAAFPKNGSEKG